MNDIDIDEYAKEWIRKIDADFENAIKKVSKYVNIDNGVIEQHTDCNGVMTERRFVIKSGSEYISDYIVFIQKISYSKECYSSSIEFNAWK